MKVLGEQMQGLLTRLVANWSAYGLVASSVAYAFGYLSIRFKLAALGVGTDMDLVDERYLFEGFRFLIQVAAGVPVIVLLALPIAGMGWLIATRSPRVRRLARAWWARRTPPLVAAVLISVMATQMVMRQCFRFDNLLLREDWPGPAWFGSMFADGDGLTRQLFFAAILAGTALPATVLVACREWGNLHVGHRLLACLLGLLVGVQIMLLPVNHGVLGCGRNIARLATPPEGAARNAVAWLIWEARNITVLVREPGRCRLITLPRDKAPVVEILNYDTVTTIRDTMSANTEPGAPAPAAWQVMIGALGLDASADSVRAPETAESQLQIRGAICLVPSRGGDQRVLSLSGDYRSPVFSADETGVYALHDDRLVKFHIHSAQEDEVAVLVNAVKLLGFSASHPRLLYYLGRTENRALLRSLDVVTREDLGLDLPSDKVQSFLSEDRAADKVQVFVAKEPTNDTYAVWVKSTAEPKGRMVAGRDLPGARQPALSPTGTWIAFVEPRPRK